MRIWEITGYISGPKMGTSYIKTTIHALDRPSAESLVKATYNPAPPAKLTLTRVSAKGTVPKDKD